MARAIFLAIFAIVLTVPPVLADIFRWDNGQLIPGTEGITPGPGVNLSSQMGQWSSPQRNLRFADFSGGLDLTQANFSNSWLDDSRFNGASLTNADLSGTNLTHAELAFATLTNANLAGANLTGANFYGSTLTSANFFGAVVAGASFDRAFFFGVSGSGITLLQLYSTASYQQRNLRGISLGWNNLTGWDFSGQDLSGADLGYSTLRNANLSGTNLTDAVLAGANLTNANLSGTNLTDAVLEFATLTNANLAASTLTSANLSGAVITRASFSQATSRGFTKEQLYSTASYQQRDLNGVKLFGNNLTGWDFSGQDLTGAVFSLSTLTNADLRGTNLADAELVGATLTNANLAGATLASANFAGAVVAGADFGRDYYAGGSGITLPQVYSTASYQQRDLRGIRLTGNDLTSGDFSGQDLTGADLGSSTLRNANLSATNLTDAVLAYANLTNANLSGTNLTDAELAFATLTNAKLAGAIVTGASFSEATSRGFTKEQLYSTASYQQRNLRGIRLGGNLTGWDFSGQDLTGADFLASTLSSANLSGAVVAGASFGRDYYAGGSGITLPQLYSTASYQQKNLRGIKLYGNDLTGGDFSGQDLTGADFLASTLSSANFAGAVVAGANFGRDRIFVGSGIALPQLYSTASYQQRDLTGLNLFGNDLISGDFSGQDLTGANFNSSRLTNADLSGTNLTNAQLSAATLTNANLAGANLTGADLTSSQLTNANLSGTNLTNAQLGSWYPELASATLTNANLAGAVIAGANFIRTTSRGFTQEQLYSTASYQQRNLRGILGLFNNLAGWDFSGQDLTGADFSASTLTSANLSGAVVTGAGFHETTSRGFRKEQLYSTASYQQRNLRGIGLNFNNLTSWDFSGQDLTGAILYSSTLTNANLSGTNLTDAYLSEATLTNANLSGTNFTGAQLSGATLTDANLAGALVAGAYFNGATSRGFTKEQLYSTASYQQKNLRGIELSGNNLTGWDLTRQDLTNASFYGSALISANLAGASLRNVEFASATLDNTNLTAADLRGARVFNADFSAAIMRNAILTNGKIPGVNLAGGDELVIRDDDGVADPSPHRGVSPRSPIPITVQDQFVIGDGGVLRLVFDADPWDSLISFEPGIPVELGGALKLSFAPGVDVPSQAGRTLDLFEWTGVTPTGRFQVQVPLDTLWDVSKLYTAGEVTVLPTSSNLTVPAGASSAAGGLRANSLTLAGNGSHLTIALIGGPSRPVILNDLSISDGATLDLTDNAAILDYTGASPVAMVREKVLSGRGGPGLDAAWTGTGITSSTAATANQAAPDSRSLGYAENAALPLGPYATFHGQPVDDTSILMAYTRTGDANLDGIVNDDDVTIVGAAYAPGVSQPSWALGDFDYNGFVDDDDVTLLGAFYDPSAPLLGLAASGSTVASAVAPVPEPSTLALLVAMAAALVFWSRFGHVMYR